MKCCGSVMPGGFHHKLTGKTIYICPECKKAGHIDYKTGAWKEVKIGPRRYGYA